MKLQHLEISVLGWKAFRPVKGRLQHLYHAHDGSKFVQQGVWLTAKHRLVHNPGSKDQPRYRAGFQFFRTFEDVQRFDKLTKGKYRFKRILARGIWRKPLKNSKTWLARSIFVPKGN